MTTETTTYMSAPEVAKRIRAALKAEFSGTKFSVRTSTYSGGASIRVTWTDGPTTAEVNAIVGPFEGSSFDGMIDLKTCNGPREALDGAVSMADHIFTDRTISDELWSTLAAKIAAYYGVDSIPARGDAWNVYVVGNSIDPHWSFDAAVRRASEEMIR